MTGALLWRGMLAGILAALLATLFARAFAEPQVDLAIAFEALHAHAHEAAGEPEIVSRATQRGAGLLTAMALYGAAIGGLFAITFALGYGRLARIGPRGFAMLLAAAGFVTVALVPALKYPATPPAVGLHETVGLRTVAYFAMIAVSLIAMAVALRVRRMAAPRLGSFDAAVAAAIVYMLVVFAAQAGLPVIDEVPATFPAVLLWSFRIASLAMQALLWGTIGLAFGALADGVIRRRDRSVA